MSRELKIILVIFISTGILALAGLYLFGYNTNHHKITLFPISSNLSFATLFGNRAVPKHLVYGFLPYWSVVNSSYFQYDKLTDIAFFGLQIDSLGNFITRTDGTPDPGYQTWTNSAEFDTVINKSKKNGVRVSLTVISHDDTISTIFLNCRSCWVNFGKNLVSELKKKGLKDVNLNFEYGGFTDKKIADKYTEFVGFTKKYLDENLGNNFLVVSTFADALVKPRVTDIAGLSEKADALFIMAYDFHRPDSDTAGPVSPVGGIGVYSDYDILTMLSDYLSVVSANKLILGVPYYGYNWIVNKNIQGSRRIPGSEEIGFSQSQSYEQIISTIQDLKPEVKWDDVSKSPYFTYKSPQSGYFRQVYFDDAKSLKYKYDLALQNRLAGVGIWALGYDGGYQDLWNTLSSYINSL